MDDTDARLLVLHPDDTVAVVRRPIDEGARLRIGGVEVTVARALTLGHKIARRAAAPGDRILKYGVPIGSATAPIAVGDHVHLHNVKSDYTPTYALDAEGDTA